MKDPNNELLNEFEILGDLETTIEEWCNRMIEGEHFSNRTVFYTQTTYRQMAVAAYAILEAQRAEYEELENQGMIKEG